MIGLIGLLPVEARAQALPGRAAVLPRCVAEASASCWDDAPSMTRFAAAPGLLMPPAAAAVRLGWMDGAVLVRIDALPAGSEVEVAVGRGVEELRISRVDGGAWDRVGVHRFPLSEEVAPGEQRPLWVNLVLPDGEGRAALPWTPAGPGDAATPGQALFAEKPALGLPWTVEAAAGKVSAVAAGASAMRIVHDRNPAPHGSRGVPEAWSVTGSDRLEGVSAVHTGWHTVEATWTGEGNRTVDLRRARVWLEPLGPAPDDPAGTGSWSVEAGARLCLEAPAFQAAADLLGEEILRFTGHQLVTEGSGPCAVRVARADGDELRGDGFQVSVAPGGVSVEAATLRGAVFGAVALADRIGPDNAAAETTILERPAVQERVLFHSINIRARPDFTVDTYIRFLRRVVTRGRYTQLHLLLNDGLIYTSHPDISHARALPAAEWRRLIDAARTLGIDVVPAVNAPGHAMWLTGAWPHLKEDVNRKLLDVRHPETWQALQAVYDETLALYGEVDRVHIGHDEALWSSHRWFGDERNPRTSATPRWLLLRDDLRRHADWAAARGLTPMLWTDLLLEPWNGRRDGAHRVLDEIDPTAFVAVAWAPLGDPVRALHEERGMRLMRVHTGYWDWKRAGLADLVDVVEGEGLGLFTPTPWSAFGPAAGTRPLAYHLGSVVLAGKTGWDPSLTQVAIAPTLAAWTDSPTLLPGYDRVAGWSGATRRLKVEGAELGADVPRFVLPKQLTAGGLDFRSTGLRAARAGHPVAVPVGARVAGVAVLQATVMAHDTQQAMLAAVTAADPGALGHAAELVVRYADGAELRRPLRYGEHTYSPAGPPQAGTLWGTAGTARMGSPAARATNPAALDRALYRVDWVNPRPEAEVASVRVETPHEGLVVIVGPAVALSPGRAP